MVISRRQFLAGSAAAAVLPQTLSLSLAADVPTDLIVDTHQHLWDLSWQNLPWLENASEVLKHSFTTADYRTATAELNVKAVYMEVDVDPSQHAAEVDAVVALCRSSKHPTVAAVVGGRPANADFPSYVESLKRRPEVKGVRQVLHGRGTPAGYCLTKEFVAGMELLGESGLSFDLCLRPGELADGASLAARAPQTRFIVDHCGNADPKAFDAKLAGDQKPTHDPNRWRRDIDRLADCPNTICKISGIVARAPQGWRSEHLAPIVNHCLEAFGPDRVVFGGDWPVCLLGAPLKAWMQALAEIIAERPLEHQRMLWATNAIAHYRLTPA